MKRALFITGIPGAGKTTLAGYLARELKRTLVTMHELAALVDPGALETGDMADERAMRRAFVQAMDQYAEDAIIVDGWPRTQQQSILLPDDSQVILLACRVDVARDRLLRRGRADDTPELATKRIFEQSALLEAEAMDSWVYRLVGWEGAINTTQRTAESVCRSVYRYLIGEKQQAFDG